MLTLMLLAVASSSLLGWQASSLNRERKHRKNKRQLLEINRFEHGLVLPSVNDPRWEIKDAPCRSSMQGCCARKVFTIGNIRCCMDHGVSVDSVGLECTWPEDEEQLVDYANAVRRATLDRMIQDTIDTHEHPQLGPIS
jgi:hypothetical protein